MGSFMSYDKENQDNTGNQKTSENKTQLKTLPSLVTIQTDNYKDVILEKKTESAWDIGQVLEGIYRLDAVLGEGGMGKVYRVRHMNWDIDLALKTIRIDKMSQNMLNLFLQEAEVWIELAKHPHIATAFYVRYVEGIPCIFVEYVEGGTLESKLSNLNYQSMLKIAIQLAEGMSYAHSKSLIHRDIKPGNILLSFDGTVKITDFGLAKKVAGEGIEGLSVAGTPPYMPPEQWSIGEKIDERSDIYAFGVLLYELFCHRRPFIMEADDPRPIAVAYQLMHLNDIPREPRDLNPDLPDILNQIILQCLRKKPEERWGSFEEVANQLKIVYAEQTKEVYTGLPFNPEQEYANDLNNWALSFMDMGNNEKAYAYWQKAIKIDPAHAVSQINKSLYTCNDQEFLPHDLRYYLSSNPETKAVSYYYKALIEACYNEYDESLNSIDISMHRGLASPELYNLKGVCHFAKNEIKNAIDSFITAKDKDSGNFGYCNNLVQAWKTIDDSKAVKLESGLPIKFNLSEKKTKRIYRLKKLTELGGHTDHIFYIGISSDNKYALSAGYKETKIWDLTNFQCLTTMSSLRDVACYQNVFICLGADLKTICVVDIKQARVIKAISGHKLEIKWLILSQDKKYIISIDESIANIWDALSFKLIHSIETLMHDALFIKLSQDSQTLGIANNNTIHVWDLEYKTMKKYHIDKKIKGIALSSYFVLAKEEAKVTIWNLQKDTPPRTISIQDRCDLYDFLPGGQFVLFSNAQTIELLDIRKMKFVKTMFKHEGTIDNIAFNHTGLYLLSSSGYNNMRRRYMRAGYGISMALQYDYSTLMWDASNFEYLGGIPCEGPIGISDDSSIIIAGNTHDNNWSVCSMDLYKVQIHKLYLNKNEFLISRSLSTAEEIVLKKEFDDILTEAKQSYEKGKYKESYQLVLNAKKNWEDYKNNDLNSLIKRLLERGIGKDIITINNIHTFYGHGDSVNCLIMSSDSSILYSGGNDNLVKVWDLENLCFQKNLDKNNNPIHALALSPTKGMILQASNNKWIKVIDLNTCKQINMLKGHLQSVNQVKISPHGDLALSASSDNTILVWDLNQFQPSHKLKGHSDNVMALAISPKHQIAVSGGKDARLIFWDLEKKEALKVISENDASLNDLGFSADGALLFSASEDGMVKIYDVPSQTCIHTFYENWAVKSLAIASRANILAYGGNGNQIQVCNYKILKKLKTLESHNGTVYALSFSNNCRFLYSGGDDNAVKVWEMIWDLEF